MSRLSGVCHQWWLIAVVLAALSLAGCGRTDTTSSRLGTTPGAGSGSNSTAVQVTGVVVGDAAAGLTDAPLPGVAPAAETPTVVPLTAPLAVTLINEAGAIVASHTVSAADGTFNFTLPTGHSYMMLFRDGVESGPTVARLILDDATKRFTFYLPVGAPSLSLGNVFIDSELGTAHHGGDVVLAASTATFPLDKIEHMSRSDVPTGGVWSPLFGAEDFSQKMVRFEEFGNEPMPAVEAAAFIPLPRPVDAQSGPLSAALDNFLAQDGVAPLPTQFANTTLASPWKADVEAYLGRTLQPAADGLVAGPADGRPSGDQWGHHVWDDLPPQHFFKTIQAGARDNGGVRDSMQLHGYAVGEFAPGGLYHHVFGTNDDNDILPGTTAGVAIRLHPLMPIQDPNSVWTFDGTLPPKLLMARYGVPVLLRHYNTLPMDVTANNGFGRHTITTHEHNGHQAGVSDGFAGAFFYPGQYFDYHWPMQLAGFSNRNNAAGAINFDANDPRAAMPCEAGETFPVLINGVSTPMPCTDGRINIPGDWRETMSTHWFHDHMIDHTAENVYKGNATMMNYYSALDRGNEAIDDGVNLRFPSGSALSWGNRDYDVNLLMADKAWDAEGQLWFNPLETDKGFLADRMTVNWLYKPYFDVRARSYRFRILNGSVSRIMAFALVHEVQGDGGELPGPKGSGVSYNRVPFHMIANDGNIMGHTIPFDGVTDVFHDGKPDAWKGTLPSQTIAERYDIVVDFADHGIQPGDKLYFVNIMEHQNGRGTRSKVALDEILSGYYNPSVKDDGHWINGDPGVGKVLELRVQGCTDGAGEAIACPDLAMNPADYEPGKAEMIPTKLDRAAGTFNGVPLANARHHTFEFVRSGGGDETIVDPNTGEVITAHGPWFIKVDGGGRNAAFVKRISHIQRGDAEVWTIKGGGGWTHPVHVHFEEGVIITRGGKMPPMWEMWARKDMYRIGPENDSSGIVEIAYQARDLFGTFVQHCHNTMHEDHAMLLRWDAMEGPTLMDTPMPTWDGVYYAQSFALPLAEIGDGVGTEKGIPTE